MAKPRVSSAEYREIYLAAKKDRSLGRPEEESSPGKSSSPSTEKPLESGNVREVSVPSPAPKTEPSSSQDPKGSSSAGSAGGDTPSDKLPFKKSAARKK